MAQSFLKYREKALEGNEMTQSLEVLIEVEHEFLAWLKGLKNWL